MLDAETIADGPVFDGPSYDRVGATLLRAAARRPQLGLKLGAQPAAEATPGHWFVGTIVATRPDASASDVRFSALTPHLKDLADRMDDGSFDGWVLDVAAALEAGVLHRVSRANATGVARMPGRATLVPVPRDRPAAERGVAAPCAGEPDDIGHLHFAEVGDDASVVRRRYRR